MNTEATPSPSPRRPGRFIKSVLSVLAIVVALLASLELGARLLSRPTSNPSLYRLTQDYGRLVRQGPDWIRFLPDEELSYRLRPDFSTGSAESDGRTVHNADGFRDDAAFPAKSPTTLRICCFGASTTYGVGVDDNEDTYPAQLEQALHARALAAGWEGVEVFNLGVGGYTSREILGTMRRMVPKLKPDVVLIQNAINDVIPRFYDDFEADYSHFRTPFTPLKLSAWHRIAYRSHAWLVVAKAFGWVKPLSLQSQTQRPLPGVDEALAHLAENAPTAFQQNLAAAVDVAQANEAQVWLLTQAYLDIPAFAGPTEDARRLEGGYRSGLREHIDVITELAQEKQVTVVPLHETMPRSQALFTDPIHMSAEGNAVKAKLIAEAIVGSLPTPHP